jgi:hypothetical protein
LEEMIIQPATLDRTEITATPFTRRFGEHDLWDLWLLDEAEEVPCGSIHTFLHYLCSNGTKCCEILNVSTIAPAFVDIRLADTITDGERNLILYYRLTHGNVGRIEEAEKDLLVRKLIEHYPTQDDNPYEKVRLALTAVGVSLT